MRTTDIQRVIPTKKILEHESLIVIMIAQRSTVAPLYTDVRSSCNV